MDRLFCFFYKTLRRGPFDAKIVTAGFRNHGLRRLTPVAMEVTSCLITPRRNSKF